MSADKYLSIFLRQMEAIVYISVIYIRYVRETYIEFTMTIFGQCHNVLNNNTGYLLCTSTNIENIMTIFGQCYNLLNK